MGKDLFWNGHRVQIYSIPAPKYLWLGEVTTLFVDGKRISSSNGFKLSDRVSGVFLHDGQPVDVSLDLKADIVTLVSIPYKLNVDGKILSQGRMNFDNWQSAVGMVVIFLLLFACVLFFYMFILR